MGVRENKDIFFYLSTRYSWGRWRGWDLFTLRFWKAGRGYIFHDTFGRRIYRLLICRVRGHKGVRNVADIGDPVVWYCFDCSEYVGHKRND